MSAPLVAVAHDLTTRGWRVIPVPFRTKEVLVSRARPDPGRRRRVIGEDVAEPRLLGTGEHGGVMVAERAAVGQQGGFPRNSGSWRADLHPGTSTGGPPDAVVAACVGHRSAGGPTPTAASFRLIVVERETSLGP